MQYTPTLITRQGIFKHTPKRKFEIWPAVQLVGLSLGVLVASWVFVWMVWFVSPQ